MAEVSNQKIIDRYRDLLANRSHDVIVMNLAIDQLEAEIEKLRTEKETLIEEKQSLERALGRANELVKQQQQQVNPVQVIPGEIVPD